MWAAIAIAALGMLPDESVVAQRVDRIEVNHVYDCSGNLVLDQVIFWDWNASESRFDCVDWRLLRGARLAVNEDQRRRWQRCGGQGVVPPPVGKWRGGHAYPRRDHAARAYVSEWYDEKSEVWRCVTSPIFLETWTAYDPELVARTILPQDQRRKLKKPVRSNCQACKPRVPTISR
jgi:hypothetical protein